MGRAPCCDKVGLKRGPWQPEEDEKLIAYIQKHGHENWRALPQKAGLLRCGKSCRLRWTNYLRPDIKRGGFSIEEDHMIIQLHSILGNRWSVIAAHIPGRTDNEIKNYWNTHLRKQLLQMGIDPVTHRLRQQLPDTSSSVFSQMALWERARMQAEARLAREYLNFIGRKQISNNGSNKKSDQLFAEWLEEYFKSFGKYLDVNGLEAGGQFDDGFNSWPSDNSQVNSQLNPDMQHFGPGYSLQQFAGACSSGEFGSSSLSTSDASLISNGSETSLPQLTEHDVHFAGTLPHEELTMDNVGITSHEYDEEVAAAQDSRNSSLQGTMLENIISKSVATEENLDLTAPFEMSPLDPLAAQAGCLQDGLDVLEFTKTESIPNNSEYWSTILKFVGT